MECNMDCKGCENKVTTACYWACGVERCKCKKDIIKGEFELNFKSPIKDCIENGKIEGCKIVK